MIIKHPRRTWKLPKYPYVGGTWNVHRQQSLWTTIIIKVPHLPPWNCCCCFIYFLKHFQVIKIVSSGWEYTNHFDKLISNASWVRPSLDVNFRKKLKWLILNSNHRQKLSLCSWQKIGWHLRQIFLTRPQIFYTQIFTEKPKFCSFFYYVVSWLSDSTNFFVIISGLYLRKSVILTAKSRTHFKFVQRLVRLWDTRLHHD